MFQVEMPGDTFHLFESWFKTVTDACDVPFKEEKEIWSLKFRVNRRSTKPSVLFT